MTNKVHQRYLQLKKAEIYLEKFIAKELEKANPKSKEDITFYMKKAEEKLFGRQSMKTMPKEVRELLKASQNKDWNWSNAAASATLTIMPPNLIQVGLTNLGKQRDRFRNKGLAIKDQKVVTPNLSLRRKVSAGSSLGKDGKNITLLLENIRSQRYLVEDVLGTRNAADVDWQAIEGMKLVQGTWDPTGTNMYHMDQFDNVTHADRKNKERALFTKLQKGNASYDNVFYKTGVHWRSQLSESSPNYHKAVVSDKSPLSISKTQEYYGTTPFNMEAGRTTWHDRRIRGPKQANDETRALLISEGANEKQVNRLNDQQLSRYRISGANYSDNYITLFGDGNLTRLKRSGNITNSPTGTVYEGTKAEKLTIKKEKPKENPLKIDPYKNKPWGSRLEFSDPL